MIRHHVRTALAAAAASAACCGLAFFPLVGCSSDATDSGASSSSSSSSSSGGTDASADTGNGKADSGTDAGTAPVNSCKNFKDETAVGSARAITWDFAVASAPERCMRIKVAQTVAWNGNFSLHPLGGQGGKTPNPVDGADQSTSTASVTFPTAGTYGFVCTAHPAMQGAIEVIE
jgi:plastocyanin